MKKLLNFLILILLICNTSLVFAASKIGKGDIILSENVLKEFIKFLRNEYAVSFVVTPDGKYFSYGICGAQRCKSTMNTTLKWCKEKSGKKCFVFAQRKKKKKIIRWDKADYIFPSEEWNYNEWAKKPTSYNLGIAKNLTDEDIFNVLNNFGFVNFKTDKTITADKDKPKTEENLEGINVSKSQIEEIIDFFSESYQNKIPIDPEAATLQFGYKNFEEFAKQYLKLFKLTDISVDEIREFLAGTDTTVIIEQSQKNLDKLYSLILNDKYFIKKNTYFKTFQKGKYDRNQISMMALAVYVNYEKEMAKITKDPNLKKVSRFTWGWGYSWGTGSNPYKYALEECERDAKKHKLFGGECMIIDWRNPGNGEIINMLRPNLKLAQRMGELKKQKLKTKKKKTIAKVEEKTKEPAITSDLTIPVQIYLVQVNKPNFKSRITEDEVRKDFNVANKIWNKKGFDFRILEIEKVNGNAKKIEKDLKWIKNKYIKSLKIDHKEQKIKSKNQKRYNQILFRIIGSKKNRNKNAINVFYIPYMPSKLACGVAYSYSLNKSNFQINELRKQNLGFIIIGEKSECKSRGRTVAHELGHMFSLGHKHNQKTDLMMWGSGTEIQNWQINKFIKYHSKYLKKRLFF